jgi:hypothetical protein
MNIDIEKMEHNKQDLIDSFIKAGFDKSVAQMISQSVVGNNPTTSFTHKQELFEVRLEGQLEVIKKDVSLLDKKIDSVEVNLNNKIDSIKTELNNKIDSIKTELNNKIDSIKTELSSKIDLKISNLQNNMTKFMLACCGFTIASMGLMIKFL